MVRVQSLPTFSKPVEGATTGICSHKEFLKLDDLIPKQMKKLEEPFVSPQIFFFFSTRYFFKLLSAFLYEPLAKLVHHSFRYNYGQTE